MHLHIYIYIYIYIHLTLKDDLCLVVYWSYVYTSQALINTFDNLNYLQTDTRTNTAFGTCIIGIDNLF